MVLPAVEPDGGPLTSTGLAAGARRLERHGFASVWAFDAIGAKRLLRRAEDHDESHDDDDGDAASA
ncbi:MAG: hypothetical protein M3503_04855, partial [Actinomycetota bacterium]|nr:hypothetical protein [Actinomycetota bacterium]